MNKNWKISQLSSRKHRCPKTYAGERNMRTEIMFPVKLRQKTRSDSSSMENKEGEREREEEKADLLRRRRS